MWHATHAGNKAMLQRMSSTFCATWTPTLNLSVLWCCLRVRSPSLASSLDRAFCSVSEWWYQQWLFRGRGTHPVYPQCLDDRSPKHAPVHTHPHTVQRGPQARRIGKKNQTASWRKAPPNLMTQSWYIGNSLTVVQRRRLSTFPQVRRKAHPVWARKRKE